MLDTHNKYIEFGKHKGERWTRLPISYLRWLANEVQGEPKEMAESELERRGVTMPGVVELSAHAIDRASQITDEWKEKGVHSWLQEIADEAWENGDGSEETVHGAYKLAFKVGNYYPILKTIIKKHHEKTI